VSVRAYPPKPGPVRGVATLALVVLGVWWLMRQGEGGGDAMTGSLGRIEVTARLVERPDEFPQLGAYRYTYVLPYEVIEVHRPDPGGLYRVAPGDRVYVGHYKPWLPRSEIRDSDWGESPLGGRLDRFVAGEAHRMALDYELADLAPSGALDYCFPPATNRFFAVWANRAYR